MSLPLITSEDLPRLAYAHGKEHDPVLTQPQKFRRVLNTPFLCKLRAGGLWTAPVTDVDYSGAIVSTAWTDWGSSEGFGSYGPSPCFLEIKPLPQFRGLRIDSVKDVQGILDVYEGPGDPGLPEAFCAVFDWEQMAQDGIDAVYLTEGGQTHTRFPEDNRYSLYGWDAASVLWLRPTYRVVD